MTTLLRPPSVTTSPSPLAPASLLALARGCSDAPTWNLLPVLTAATRLVRGLTRERPEPARARPHGAPLGRVVDGDQAEARSVAVLPLEVVEQRPVSG